MALVGDNELEFWCEVSIPLISGLVTDANALTSLVFADRLNPFDFRAGY